MSAPAASLIAYLRRRYVPLTADGDLVRAYAADRDGAAFQQIVVRHGPAVLRLCRRRLGDLHAAEDAFQATFLVLARSAGSIRKPDALAAWLYGVAYRITRKARARRTRQRQLEGQATVPPSSLDPADELSARELLDALDEELHRLPERYRLPLWLCYWQRLSQDETARRLGCSPGAVKGRLERGRAKLAERLTRRGFAPSALLVAPLGTAAVSPDLLAATAALAADPWSKALPAAVLALAATAVPVKLMSVAALGVVLVGVGWCAWSTGGAPVADAANPQAAQVDPQPPRVDRCGDPLPDGALLRLGSLRYRGDSQISHVSARAGGRAAFCAGSAVVVMDVQTGKTVQRFDHWTNPANGQQWSARPTCLAFAPDGRTFAVGFTNNTAPPVSFLLCDAATGQVLREFPWHNEQVEEIAFLADGRQIATFGAFGVLRVWDAATAAKRHEWKGPDRKLVSIAASPDGHTLAAGAEARDGTGAIYLWDAANGKLLHTLSGHTADVRAVAFAPDGHTLASGGNAVVRLWDVATGRELRQFAGHAKMAYGKSLSSIRSLAFSPDGRLIASASNDHTVRAWSIAAGQALDDTECLVLQSHPLAFADDRTLLVAEGNVLLLRDVAARAFKNRAAGATYGVTFVGYSSDGRTIATTDPTGTTYLWDAANGENLLAKHWSPVSAFTFVSSDGRRAGFTEMKGEDFTPCVGDTITGQVVRRLPESNRVAIVLSPDGRRLVTGLARELKAPEEAMLHIWDTTTGVKLGQLPAVEGSMMTVVLSPDGRFVFMGEGRDPPYRLRKWDVATGQPVQEFALPKDMSVRSLAVSRGGRRVAAIADDDVLRLWDVVTGQEYLRVKPTLGDPQAMMAFSPDGTMLAVGGGDIELWDTRTGQRLATLPGTLGVAFSPDSRRLVAGCGDGTALVWDVEAAIGRKVPPMDDARQAMLWDALAGDSLATYAIDCWQAAPQVAVPFLRRKLPDADDRRCERAVEILEAIATPDARALLEDLAKGDPAARLTRAAQASLERLRRER